jgi:hypothetical protein
MRRMSAGVFWLLVVCACGSGSRERSASSSSGSEDAPARTPAEARAECVAVMMRTRECEAPFVSALMDLRVRLDRPPGIRDRFAAEGEEAMLTIAREEFARDWSDEAIATNCDRLAARPVEEREAILETEGACLHAADCQAFVECDIANKERRWTSE